MAKNFAAIFDKRRQFWDIVSNAMCCNDDTNNKVKSVYIFPAVYIPGMKGSGNNQGKNLTAG